MIPSDFTEKSLAGEALSRDEARAVLQWPDEDILSLLSGAFAVRRVHFGKRVKMNFLVNVKSGLCPEDCSYCSQSKISTAPIEKYRLMGDGEILAAAKQAVESKAARLCLVASGRGPSAAEVERLSDSVRRVRETYPQLQICCSLGLLGEGQADELKEAGVHAYNHNLNTTEQRYDEICSTHTFQDRVATLQKARDAGLSPCSGAILGMGESDEDIVDLAFALRAKKADSIPLNFLIPIEGTPLGKTDHLTPVKCLKILCLFRFLSPSAELRIAAGREIQLRSLQPLGLFAANSIFIGDYLTTRGQSPQQDIQMIRDLGFEIEGEISSEEPAAPRVPELVSLIRRSPCS